MWVRELEASGGSGEREFWTEGWTQIGLKVFGLANGGLLQVLSSLMANQNSAHQQKSNKFAKMARLLRASIYAHYYRAVSVFSTCRIDCPHPSLAAGASICHLRAESTHAYNLLPLSPPA